MLDLVEGSYIVVVEVIDGVGNIGFDFEIGGVVDIILLVIDVVDLGVGNDVILIISGMID